MVDNVQSLSAKGNSVLDRVDQLLADNSPTINSTLQNADVFAKALADNAPNIDVTLEESRRRRARRSSRSWRKSRTCRRTPIAWSRRSNRTRSTRLVDNAQTFSQALAESSDNFKALARDGAVLAGHLNNSASGFDTRADRRRPAPEGGQLPEDREHRRFGERRRSDRAAESRQHRFDAQELSPTCPPSSTNRPTRSTAC